MIELLRIIKFKIFCLLNQLNFKRKKAFRRIKSNSYDPKHLKSLDKDGFVLFPKVFSDEECEELVKLNGFNSLAELHQNFQDEISRHFKLSPELESYFEEIISKKNPKLKDFILDYLCVDIGDKYFDYENCIHTRGTPASDSVTLVPHHDTKFNRLKLYLWLSDGDEDTHPLYYIKGDHNNIKLWYRYEETRFPNLQKSDFLEIKPQRGDIIIFDTHGVHSFTKGKTSPRAALLKTYDPNYLGPDPASALIRKLEI